MPQIRGAFQRWWNPEPPIPSLLIHLTWMEKLDKVIVELDKKCRANYRKPTFRYWEQKWEEAVALYMEYEWELHSGNPDALFPSGREWVPPTK